MLSRGRFRGVALTAAALAAASACALPAMADGRGRGYRGRGWNDCNDGWNVRYSGYSGWRSSGSSFSISIGSGWDDCYPSRVYCPPVRRVAYCPPPVVACPPPVVISRPVIVSQPVYTQPVYTQPVVYQPVYTQPVVVQQTRVVETAPVVQTVSQPVYTRSVAQPAPVAVAGEPPNPATSAAEDLTRALAAANQGEDRRAVELMRAYFRTYSTVPGGLVISRPMLERLEGAYTKRCETEEPSPDTYFVLAVVRGLLGNSDGAVAALDAGRAWGDQDGSSQQARAWLESR